MTTEKVAVDNSAKDYWKNLYGRYGEELCRNIPRRIKSVLTEKNKVASVDDIMIKPLAITKSGGLINFEGLCAANGSRYLVNAEFNDSGDISNVSIVDL